MFALTHLTLYPTSSATAAQRLLCSGSVLTPEDSFSAAGSLVGVGKGTLLIHTLPFAVLHRLVRCWHSSLIFVIGNGATMPADVVEGVIRIPTAPFRRCGG